MAGAIAKAKDAAGYEAIVQETMVKEDCTYEEAVERYNALAASGAKVGALIHSTC